MKLQELRAKFKKIALEVFKEMYGFYNTETGGGPGGVLGEMLGNEPLSAQEKRMLEKQLNEQMDNTLTLMESLTSMNDADLSSQLSSLLGSSGLGDALSDEDLADWVQELSSNGGAKDQRGQDGVVDDLLGSLSNLLN